MDGEVVVTKMETTRLLELAFEDYKLRGGSKDLETASIHDLNHIALNYIRHKLVKNYHRVKIEDPWEYFMWFSKVNRLIAYAYPFLETTVEQQIRRKEYKLSNERKGFVEL